MPRHPFYNTKTWKHLRKVKLISDPLCEACRRKPATDIDHVVALNKGGSPTAMENLRSLCHACHSRKTLFIERLGRDRVPVRGCNRDGTPLDPLHPWNDKGKGEIVDSEALQRKKEFAVAEAKDRALVAPQSKFRGGRR